MTMMINPAWKAWNDLQNEGGEGYNPHAKWIAKPVSATVAAAQSSRMLKDESGNLIPESKLRARLAKDKARLETATNPSAIEIIKAAIAFAESQLS